MTSQAPIFRQLTSSIFVLAIIGLFFSKIVLSVSFILFPILALSWWISSKKKPIVSAVWPFAALSLSFFIIVFSAFKGGDSSIIANQLQKKLPFLSMALALWILPGLNRRQMHWIVLVYGSLALITGLYTYIYYLLNMDFVHEEMLKGRGFPNPVKEHIRYALMLCMGVAAWAFLLIDGFLKRKMIFPILAWSSIAFLVVLIHVMSVRSGWLALYLLGFYFLFRYLFLSRKFLLGSVLLIGLITAPIAAYYSIESVQNKVNYMIYDLKMTRAGHIDGLNDARRITSIQVGLGLAKTAPLTGVGVGHLKGRTEAYYFEHYPQMTDPWGRKMPHNQFVWFLAATGVLGVLLFSCSFFFPFFHCRAFLDPLMVSIYLVIGSSLLTEATFGRQLGIALFLIFVTLVLNERKAVLSHHQLQ